MAIYDDDQTPEEYLADMQSLVDSGDAWRLEGSIGRAAHDLIMQGQLMLGPEAQRDYWGNYVPSRFDVEPGTPGSPEYVAEVGS